MVLDVKDRVAELIEQGISFDEVLAARPTADYEEKRGDPERFLGGVYAGVGGGS